MSHRFASLSSHAAVRTGLCSFSSIFHPCFIPVESTNGSHCSHPDTISPGSMTNVSPGAIGDLYDISTAPALVKVSPQCEAGWKSLWVSTERGERFTAEVRSCTLKILLLPQTLFHIFFLLPGLCLCSASNHQVLLITCEHQLCLQLNLQ